MVKWVVTSFLWMADEYYAVCLVLFPKHNLKKMAAVYTVETVRKHG